MKETANYPNLGFQPLGCHPQGQGASSQEEIINKRRSTLVPGSNPFRKRQAANRNREKNKDKDDDDPFYKSCFHLDSPSSPGHPVFDSSLAHYPSNFVPGIYFRCGKAIAP
jgi:hypothetical protein